MLIFICIEHLATSEMFWLLHIQLNTVAYLHKRKSPPLKLIRNLFSSSKAEHGFLETWFKSPNLLLYTKNAFPVNKTKAG